MAQHDYSIANGGGAAVRSDINDALQAIITQNSGPTEPTVTRPYMLWNDTAAGALKIRNAIDTAWVLYSEYIKPSTDTVLTATAAASAGAVGTYMMARLNNGNLWPFVFATGSTVAGSNLCPAAIMKNSGGTFSMSISPTALSGTWRFMSYADVGSSSFLDIVGLWLRIS